MVDFKSLRSKLGAGRHLCYTLKALSHTIASYVDSNYSWLGYLGANLVFEENFDPVPQQTFSIQSWWMKNNQD